MKLHTVASFCITILLTASSPGYCQTLYLPFTDTSFFSKYDYYFIGESHPEKYSNNLVMNRFIEACKKEKKITYLFIEISPCVERVMSSYIRTPNDSLKKILKSLAPKENLLSLAQMLNEKWQTEFMEDSLFIVPIETEVVWWLPFEELYSVLSQQNFYSEQFANLLKDTQIN